VCGDFCGRQGRPAQQGSGVPVRARMHSAMRPWGSRACAQDVHDIMGAGHETTASTAAAALWAIAAHPEVEARVHAELDAVLGAPHTGAVSTLQSGALAPDPIRASMCGLGGPAGGAD